MRNIAPVESERPGIARYIDDSHSSHQRVLESTIFQAETNSIPHLEIGRPATIVLPRATAEVIDRDMQLASSVASGLSPGTDIVFIADDVIDLIEYTDAVKQFNRHD